MGSRSGRGVMGVGLQRAGIAMLVVAAVLAAVYVGLLRGASSGRSAGAGQAGRAPAAGSDGGSGRRSGQTTGNPGAAARAASGSPDRAASGQPGRATSGRAGAVGPSAVTLGGAAALPGVDVHPGYDSPEDAVDGFYQALFSGTPTRACAYATQPCPATISGRITGNVSILAAASRGDEALVEVSGTICISGSCLELADLVVMPINTPSSFSSSWASLTSRIYGFAGSPLPCVQDTASGQWHVKLA